MNILVVKANNRPATEGISSKMYETFIEATKDLNVTTYDVFEEDMPYLGQDLFDAFGNLQQGKELTDVQQRLLNAKQKAKDAVSNADVIVFAFPLWNLTIPAKLHTFMDYIFEAGFAFKYSDTGELLPLMTDKKAILLNARGGVYSAPEMAQLDMSLNYMRNALGGTFGMEIIDEVIIEGHNAMPNKAESIVAEGLASVSKVAENLASHAK
ncbi:FMN-dependent NADH-azoreductase [Paraliobacillus ryukyuensis]|uniref:FMN-dependent NADH-azoreductase n=1 Tax=Paraliobacillus ryukyuensis TaxID=200904 RepID=UPI0009A6E055|nr:FMN-dependent NADH-azoreductase [Paraliobacillus ryukyuensis]